MTKTSQNNMSVWLSKMVLAPHFCIVCTDKLAQQHRAQHLLLHPTVHTARKLPPAAAAVLLLLQKRRGEKRREEKSVINVM
jgi:hypothetical protein